MRKSSGPTVDMGAFSIFTGILVMFVFWWVYFMESLTGTSSVVADER